MIDTNVLVVNSNYLFVIGGMNNLIRIGRCAGCQKMKRLEIGSCSDCKKRYGENSGPILQRIRRDPAFALLCYRGLTQEYAKQEFMKNFGNCIINDIKIVY